MRREINGIYRIINQKIKSFGKINGLPLFRLVWSDNETEKRFGTFNEFYGEIFIRRVTETREVEKYWYLSERWVLEKWAPPEKCFTPEISSTQYGSYEPIWVFEDSVGNPLDPTLKVVEFIINYHNDLERNRVGPLTRAAQLRDEDAKKKLQEIKEIEDSLDITVLGTQLHSREAVGYTKGLDKWPKNVH